MSPLLTREEFARCALLAAMRHRTRTVLEEKLGRAQCMATFHEKVIVASMPLGDHELALITVDITAKNFQIIMRKMLRLIGTY